MCVGCVIILECFSFFVSEYYRREIERRKGNKGVCEEGMLDDQIDRIISDQKIYLFFLSSQIDVVVIKLRDLTNNSVTLSYK